MTEGKIEAKLKVLASELAELREKVALMEERCAIRHECDEHRITLDEFFGDKERIFIPGTIDKDESDTGYNMQQDHIDFWMKFIKATTAN